MKNIQEFEDIFALVLESKTFSFLEFQKIAKRLDFSFQSPELSLVYTFLGKPDLEYFNFYISSFIKSNHQTQPSIGGRQRTLMIRKYFDG